ncbi:MAG: flagellar hook-length control protein FliK [Armatimonadetes bacterium]|nr:flagellar hook-length control protein FliK [Armatimonadota bacterium]
MNMLNGGMSNPNAASIRTTAAGNTGAAQVQGRASGVGPFAPPGAKGPGQPPSVVARLPPGQEARALFNPGSVLHGRVEGQDGNAFYLRLGEHVLKAQSRVPLRVGQSVTFEVQGQNVGQLHLQLIKSPFTKMSSSDISLTLANLKLPASEANVALAKTMLEHNIPLTRENMAYLKTVLAQTAGDGGRVPSTTSRVGAAHFLQSSQLPATPQNVTALANFMATNPQLGVQMFTLNHEFRRLAKTQSGDSRTAELLNALPGALGEFILDPRRRNTAKRNSEKLFDAARQLGIESHLGTAGGGEDAWDLLAMMRELRQNLEADAQNEDVSRVLTLMREAEENLLAHKLINQAKPESTVGYYYLQVPMRLDEGECAEIWVRYHTDDEGEKFVDSDSTRIEFLVNTEHLGELSFTVDLAGGMIHVDLGTPSEEVREFATRYLLALVDRLQTAGWVPGRVWATYRPFSGKRRLVEHTNFEDLERCNVQA